MESIVYTESEHFLALRLLCSVVRRLKEDGYHSVNFWDIAADAGHTAVAYQECQCSKIIHPAKI